MTNSIADLKFDDKNFNKHNAQGMALLEKSLKELGAGRSILLDKDNNIIAGNGIVEAAGQAGFEKVKIIETDGTELIAVKRTDMELDSEQGREMALADNATASANLEWDEETLRDTFSDDELGAWGVTLGGVMLTETGDIKEEETPEPTISILTVSTYAREKDGGSAILAQVIAPEVADKIQDIVSEKSGTVVIDKILEGLDDL